MAVLLGGMGFVFEVFGAIQGEGPHSKAGYFLCGCAGDGFEGGEAAREGVVEVWKRCWRTVYVGG